MKKQENTFVEVEADAVTEPETKPIETVRTPFETVLKCKLTDAETLAYAREMAEVSANVSELEDEMKSLAAEYKAKIAIKEARRDILGKYVATGYEHRSVKCERCYDYEEKLVTEVRMDGQDPHIINQRGMTGDELQRQLELIEK
jgi:hypothetical protein